MKVIKKKIDHQEKIVYQQTKSNKNIYILGDSMVKHVHVEGEIEEDS